ncbi:pantoate--beta-alanine ligase [Dyadobacter sandarakinus]|uniref:Pantothenate synthetase n=1 Tax=Dyadobacter sandarakinus TaxID=2747268 RepID=A0ABX7IBX9_9BACT|nr:pantoate--beta-alanine ligase [Dyadobacter sandarakinus]QRR03500.1 pantoate--beta-alanine ligase [Dyadobacter sandarakinus]
MEVFTSVSGLRKFLSQQFLQQKSIGLVPTMGALHQGHLALVEAAAAQNDIAVTSIFVNPTQFNNVEDLAKYPRTLEADLELLRVAGCHAVFAPSTEEMYPAQPALKFDFGPIETIMEGASRPGHFNGVGIVVSKLFHMVKPHRAYFGQKDLQQVAVVKRMVADLSFDLEIVVFPTVREADGLAMSSRNRRLSPAERLIAPHIYQILTATRDRIQQGETVGNAKYAALQAFSDIPELILDYIEIVDTATLQNIPEPGEAGTSAICVAVQLGPVRLIDNLIF